MAFFSFKFPLVLVLSSLLLHATFADIICEELPKELCAFSVSSSGKRCLLETDQEIVYQCRTSEVVVDGITNYVESDTCVGTCGVDRKSVGISSDALLEPGFAVKLCSPECYKKCPNIIDLYFNLAAGEGAFLPDLCNAQRANPHRWMLEIMSSGVATAPASAEPSSEDLIASLAPEPF